MTKSSLSVLAALLLSAANLTAQTPTDALMMEKGQFCLAAIYSHDTWDEYWEGTLKRNNDNVGTLTRQTVMPMFALGIVNKINLLAALPWAKTEASAGQVSGASGLQDWGVWLKAEPLNKELGAGYLTLHGVAGLTGKASNYLSDFAPFSLGLGCTDFSMRGIVEYELKKGMFARWQTGYHLRGYSQIERDFYFTDRAVYSDQVEVPNAVTYGATLGSWLLKHSLRIEVNYEGLNSLSGNDIRRQDAGFPSNKMVFSRLSGGFQYYLPFVKGLGVLANYGTVLSGRNVGQSTTISGGVTYQFGVWK